MSKDARVSQPPAAPVTALHLEDSDLDAEFVRARLEAAGLAVAIERVSDRKGFLNALKTRRFDAVLADYHVPTFDGLAALDLAREHQPDVPFLFVSGAMGEELAVETLRRGATDYVLKDRLGRLPAAVERAVAEARTRAVARTAEERQRLVFASVRDHAIFSLDLDGRVADWNPGAEHIFGWREGDIVGRSAAVVFTPEDRAAGRPEEEMHLCRTVGRAENSRWHLRADGSRFWADGSMEPLRDEAGRLRGYVKVVRDRTARRAADALAAGQKRALELAVGGAPLGDVLAALAGTAESLSDGDLLASVLLLDRDGRRLRHGAAPSLPAEYNRAIDGLEVGPAVGSCGTAAFTGREAVAEDLAADPRWAAFRDLALAHGLRACWSTPLLSSRGRVLGTFALYHRRPQGPTDRDRAVVGVLSNTAAVVVERHREAEDRERAEADLRASEERYRTLFESMDEGYCIIEVLFDPAAGDRAVDYRFLEVNPAFEAQAGLRDVVGRRMREFVADIEPHWLDGYGRVARTGEPVRFANEYTGLGRWFEVYAFRVGPADARRVAVLFTDITARRAAEAERERLVAELSEAGRRKDEFLATLAHELRNPLAPLRTGLAVLRSGGADGQAPRLLGMMDRQLGHLVHLVDDLLDVSRVTSGKITLRAERFDLREVVEAAVETSRPLVEGAGHRLSVTVAPGPLPLAGDRTRLAQVLTNLLNNAAKYTPPGGRIELAVLRDGGRAAVRVADDGAGIPADMLPRVFEVFTQVGRTLDRSQGGLGLGLALVKRLVEMHGGSVTAESDGPGAGSTFTVRLPLADEVRSEERGSEETGLRAARIDSPHSPAPRPSLPPRRVLVVDDNVDAADSLALLLSVAGHRTRTVHSGPAALEEARTFRPEVVFLDLGMPGMTGFEVAATVRADPGLAGVTLVALTGWGSEDDRRRTRASGFDFHLTKPVDAAAVQAVLAATPAGC